VVRVVLNVVADVVINGCGHNGWRNEDGIQIDGQWLSTLVGGSWIMCQNTFEIIVKVMWLVVVGRQLGTNTKSVRVI
jgi:metal-dependent hydrolase (beta-lactamase superfamily II)